ncbi:MAG: CBS domain-containing protein [Caldilineaceae bacterium]|nr:CBS domain-containing protein [Caldilineaceae bacterium]
MLVRDCMTRHPILISPNRPAPEAERLLSENRIRHLPVVGDGKRLVGLITRQRLSMKPEMLGSLNVWEISRYLADLKVKQIMIKRKMIVTVDENRSVERAASLMSENKIGCLPIVDDDDVVVGVVTEVDISRVFQEMLGLPMDGLRVTVRMPNRPGEFAKLARVIADRGWDVIGIGTFPSRRNPGFYDAVLKIPNVTEEEVSAELGKIEEQAVVDVRFIV